MGVAAVIEHANAEEERAGRDAVAEHLEYSTLDRNRIEREDSEYDEAEVAYGCVSDQALQIGLHHGDQRAVNDADNREDGDRPRRRHGIGAV